MFVYDEYLIGQNFFADKICLKFGTFHTKIDLNSPQTAKSTAEK